MQSSHWVGKHRKKVTKAADSFLTTMAPEPSSRDLTNQPMRFCSNSDASSFDTEELILILVAVLAKLRGGIQPFGVKLDDQGEGTEELDLVVCVA